MHSRIVLSIIASVLTVNCAFGQAPHTNPFPGYKISAGKVDGDGLPTSGAKLCLLAKPDRCFQMHAETASGNQFGLEPHAQRLPLPGGGSWVYFTAMFSGGGSGTLTQLAVLRFDPSGEIVDLLPYVAATNVSEHAMWTVPKASSYPILVHADFIWGDGETHFDRHFYTVEAWRFDPKLDRYVKAFSYQTSKKYGGGDVQPVTVLQPEREEIIKRLSDLNPAHPDPHP